MSRRQCLLTGGAAALGLVAPPVDASGPSATVHDLLVLPTLYGPHIDPALCLVSEKYDGVRACWDGQALRHRSGRTVAAPRWFVEALPAMPLDGELWLGRGRFDALSALVRRAEPVDAEWRQVRFMVFETPGAAGPFSARVEAIRRGVAEAHTGQLEAAPQQGGYDRAALLRRLDETVAAGGEGLMLHLASAPFVSGRSDALTKLKPHLDAEAVVIDHRPGGGKYTGQLGALQVRAPDGREFFVGSGLTDDMRRAPLPRGTVVTYRYRDLTPSGLPRFPTFVRVHEAL